MIDWCILYTWYISYIFGVLIWSYIILWLLCTLLWPNWICILRYFIVRNFAALTCTCCFISGNLLDALAKKKKRHSIMIQCTHTKHMRAHTQYNTHMHNTQYTTYTIWIPNGCQTILTMWPYSRTATGAAAAPGCGRGGSDATGLGFGLRQGAPCHAADGPGLRGRDHVA